MASEKRANRNVVAASLPAPRPERPGEMVRARLRDWYRESRDYAGHQAAHDDAYFSRYRAVLEATLPGMPLCVLEIGAGGGTALAPVITRRPGSRVVALDLAVETMQDLRAGGDGPVDPVAADALDLPFGRSSFDAVAGFEVLEHLTDVEGALEEMLRVLRRPGYIVLGIPNHGSLWTPIEDILRGRRRLAFGVLGPAGALRWWWQNVRIAARKRLLGSRDFLYREPVLDGGCGGDWDAIWYACPIDVIRYLRRRGARIVTTSVALRLGAAGRLLPAELQGSAVIAFRIDS